MVLSEVIIYFSTYFGHNFSHSLQLEFNSSCQIKLDSVRRHINPSGKFFLVASSVCFIDSDSSRYLGQNLSHRLELGFDPRRQIILERDRHRNLPGNLIPAYLAASWSVYSEFRTYIGQNLQFRLQLKIHLNSQTSLYFNWDHSNRFAELNYTIVSDQIISK